MTIADVFLVHYGCNYHMVCVGVCMHVFIYVCVSVYMCKYGFMFVCVNVGVCVCVCVCVSTYISFSGVQLGPHCLRSFTPLHNVGLNGGSSIICWDTPGQGHGGSVKVRHLDGPGAGAWGT